MGWTKGRKRGAEQGNDSSLPDVPGPTSDEAAPEGLDDFIAWAERRFLHNGVVVVSMTHPDVKAARAWDGVYSGFQLAPGPASAKWSSGAAYPANTETSASQ